MELVGLERRDIGPQPRTTHPNHEYLPMRESPCGRAYGMPQGLLFGLRAVGDQAQRRRPLGLTELEKE
jgi:hypothetical protein